MKVCVFGAGAIGGHVAGRLSRGGADVSVVARGAHLAAMQANGLRVITPEEEFHAPVRAVADAATLGTQDAVIVTVKAPALPSVAAGIGPLLGPDTAVVFVMNGIPWWYHHKSGGEGEESALPLLDPGGALQAVVGFGRAIGGVVYSACTVQEPGVVLVENRTNRIVLGEPDGTVSSRAQAIAAPLVQGGMTIEVSDRIRDFVWSKLLMNLGSGPLGVLTGSPPRDFYVESALEKATLDAVAEAKTVAEAMGCTVSANAAGHVANGKKSGHKTSILQDLELGRPMEIDALYTVPLEMARAKGVPTPFLDLLSALTRARARTAGLYAG